MADGSTEKKAKGVKKSAVKSNITFDDYVNCGRTLGPKSVTMNVIRSREHVIHIESVTGHGLSVTGGRLQFPETSPSEHSILTLNKGSECASRY